MPASDLTTSDVRYVEIKPGYRVGDDGSVWSCVRPGRYHRFGSWHRLKPTPQHRGHMSVYLGRRDQRFVHQLVLEAFIGRCPDGMGCRHLDGNPGNNRLDNLAWGTPKANHADSVRHGTAYCLRPEFKEQSRRLWDYVEHKSGEKHHRAKLSDEQVAIIRATVDLSKRDGMTRKLANEWGVTYTTVRMIARGVRRCSP